MRLQLLLKKLIITLWSRVVKITAFHVQVCSEMASVSIPRLKCNVPRKCVDIRMWFRKLSTTTQLLNKAELSASFCSVGMFLCLYHWRRQEALLWEFSVSVLLAKRTLLCGNYSLNCDHCEPKAR